MNRKRLATFWEQYGTLCILVLIIVVFSGLSSDFMKPENIVQIFVQSAITILVALGEFFAILIAGIDLSVGSIVAITGILTAKLMVAGLHPILAVLVGGIGVGIVLGAFNGMLVNFTGLHPFIITLGTNAIFRGLTFIISGASPVFGFPYEFVLALTGNIWIVPVPVVLALAVAGILWFVCAKTRLGRNIYALGGNRRGGILFRNRYQAAHAYRVYDLRSLFRFGGCSFHCASWRGRTGSRAEFRNLRHRIRHYRWNEFLWRQGAHPFSGCWRPYHRHDQQWPEHAPHPNILSACCDG